MGSFGLCSLSYLQSELWYSRAPGVDLCVYWKAEVGLFFQWWKITLDQITGWSDESKVAFIL